MAWLTSPRACARTYTRTYAQARDAGQALLVPRRTCPGVPGSHDLPARASTPPDKRTTTAEQLPGIRLVDDSGTLQALNDRFLATGQEGASSRSVRPPGPAIYPHPAAAHIGNGFRISKGDALNAAAPCAVRAAPRTRFPLPSGPNPGGSSPALQLPPLGSRLPGNGPCVLVMHHPGTCVAHFMRRTRRILPPRQMIRRK